jgi:Zn-dependent protease
MRSSLKIFTLFKIPVYVHWTFSLLIFYIIYSGYSDGQDKDMIVREVLFTLCLFTCVVLHEFGHALMARKYGIQTEDIVLLPLGGMARLHKMSDKPWHEFWIALAGPAVNVVIAVVLFLYFQLTESTGFFEEYSFSYVMTQLDPFWKAVMVINIVMVVFNMIPAFPMDGGRVLRALISLKLNRAKATLIATRFGQLIAAFFFLFGFWNEEYTLGFIGLFIAYAGQSEYKSVKVDEGFKKIKFSEIFRTDFTFLSSSDIMQTALEKYSPMEKNFLVREDYSGMVIGFIAERKIREAKEKNDLNAPITNYIERMNTVVYKEDTLADVIENLQHPIQEIWMVQNENGELIGVIDSEKVESYLI